VRLFEHKSAESFQEAGELLKASASKNGTVIAGGTDLIGGMKTAILPDKDNPQVVIDLKTIKDSAYIKNDGNEFRIGALTTLCDIADSNQLQSGLEALAEAAKSVATPVIRNIATIGGNICQDVRCWYYRYPHDGGGRMECSRKGGDTCYAIQGENRYHSVFGGMKTHATACAKACPAGTDISAYMEKLRHGDWDGAARIIMNVNPMPMLTSRICPHPCQDGCNQGNYGDPVGISCVERTLGDYIMENASKFYRKPADETGKKIAVVGAGPGGLTCAYFLRSQGHDVTIIDAHEKAGGVLYYGIPHYRLPKALVEKFTAAIGGMGVKFLFNTLVGKDVLVEDLVSDYDMVYFGTGAWTQPILGVRGEELTEFGLNFLVEVNTFLKKAIDDEVLVCGGGNVAMDAALTAKRLGAKKVRLVCLEQAGEMPASAEEIARAAEEGVEIFNGWGLKGVVTDADGKVRGLESMRCVSVFDENGHFAPRYDMSDLTQFNAKAILLATGQKVDLGFLGDKFGPQLKTARGLFNVNQETYQTENVKIYAGGDAVTGSNLAILAIHAGAVAANTMSRQLGNAFPVAIKDAGFLKFDAEGVKQKEAAKLLERSVNQRTLMDEDAQSLTRDQAQKEAGRCMNCGCYSVNPSDISPVLLALDADIATNKKSIKAADFFTARLKARDMLDVDEIVMEIKLCGKPGYITGYDKFRVRESVDFAVVSLAFAYKLADGKIEDIRLVFGGVSPVPLRVQGVEEYLKGKAITAQVIEEAGKLACQNSQCMELNSYKLQEMKAAINRLLRKIA
jgi:NADPH-dependent glutamate synthase beta subunit-like oxidoreductase